MIFGSPVSGFEESRKNISRSAGFTLETRSNVTSATRENSWGVGVCGGLPISNGEGGERHRTEGTDGLGTTWSGEAKLEAPAQRG